MQPFRAGLGEMLGAIAVFAVTFNLSLPLARDMSDSFADAPQEFEMMLLAWADVVGLALMVQFVYWQIVSFVRHRRRGRRGKARQT